LEYETAVFPRRPEQKEVKLLTLETPATEAEEHKKELKRKGKKAMKLNVVFFLILFLGVLMVPVFGLQVAAIAITVACALCLLYIYFT
jgi:Na+/H+ antiporter NhaD/arsenite permease-like protein